MIIVRNNNSVVMYALININCVLDGINLGVFNDSF